MTQEGHSLVELRATVDAMVLHAIPRLVAIAVVLGPAPVASAAEPEATEQPVLPAHLSPPPVEDGWMTPAERQRYGWARAGATTGLAMGLAGFGFGFASEITLDDGVPSFITGGLDAALLIAATPIAFAGGRSSRRRLGVRGNRGLRIASWALYGAGAAQLPFLFGWGAFVDRGNTRIPNGIVISNASLLLVATSLMVADAMIVHRRAMEVRAYETRTAARVQGLSVGARPLGHEGLLVGVSGRF